MQSRYLNKFFINGKTMIIPIDHGQIIPVPGLENPAELISNLNPYTDGYITNLGMARRFSREIGDKGIVLRTDNGNTFINKENPDGAFTLYGTNDARSVHAHAMMNMLFPGHPNEAEIIQGCANLISDGIEENIPVMLEALPFGLGRPDDYTVENIRFCVHLACELGAHVVKTAYPGDKEAFREICAESFVPVIVLGGAAKGDDLGVLRMVSDSMEAGAAGIAVGRSLWQSENPVKLAKLLYNIVHESVPFEETMKAYESDE